MEEKVEEEKIKRIVNQTEDSIEFITETDELILKNVLTKDKLTQEIIKKED